MSHQVVWTKVVLERFIFLGNLTQEEEMIIRTRCAGWNRQRQATELNMSIATVDRHIKSLKQKYDEAQKYDTILPPRRKSSKEPFLGMPIE